MLGVDVGSGNYMAMMAFLTRLKSRKNQPIQESSSILRLVMNGFQTTFGGRFAYACYAGSNDAELESAVAEFNEVVTDTATELLRKQFL